MFASTSGECSGDTSGQEEKGGKITLGKKDSKARDLTWVWVKISVFVSVFEKKIGGQASHLVVPLPPKAVDASGTRSKDSCTSPSPKREPEPVWDGNWAIESVLSIGDDGTLNIELCGSVQKCGECVWSCFGYFWKKFWDWEKFKIRKTTEMGVKTLSDARKVRQKV